METEKTELQKGTEPGKNMLFDWVDALVNALIFVILLFTLVVRVTGVIGSSMEPTLYQNDKLVITKWFYTPKQGDIVIVSKASFGEDPIVKRVIATENQTVDIDFVAGTVTVDGEVLVEPYIKEITRRPGDVSFPVTVPPGCVFVMGDNRNASTDSRTTMVGMVDEREIIGRVIYRIFPLKEFGTVK